MARSIGTWAAVCGLRRAILPALLSLPLLSGFAADASAQTCSSSASDTAGVTFRTSLVARTLGKIAVTENGNYTDAYTVKLDSRPTHDVVITVRSSLKQLPDFLPKPLEPPENPVQLRGPGASAYDTTIELTFTPSNWCRPQSVTAKGIDDDYHNAPWGPRIAIIAHTAKSDDGDYDGIDISSLEITAWDDEPGWRMKPTVSATRVAEGGTVEITFKVWPALKLWNTLVKFSVAPTSRAGNPAEYADLPPVRKMSLTIPAKTTTAKATFTLPDDELVEGDEKFTISIERSWGVDRVGSYVIDMTIVDNDGPPTPEITIAADAGSVTEGGSASFTLTADPAPAAPLDVTVTVAATGDYGIAAGERTVTVPTTGSTSLTLATAGDDADEADGSVTATVDAGDGYTVGTESSGTVAIADDDVPDITIAADAASVAEGGSASFTLAADPAPAAPLDVTVTVAATGDYGITAGERTVTVPTTGSATLTLATTGDDVDEADGSVSATVKAGNGYTVGSPSSGTVAVVDGDEPEVTIAADAASVAEGGSASFTLTANRAPAALLDVTVTVAASGDYGITAGERTVTIPTTGSATLTLATAGDDADEANGSVSATVKAGTGYTVGSPSSGTVAIADDDVPEVTIAADAGSVTEGGNASFTLTADPAPAAPLDVTVTIAAEGDYGITAGERTVTIPTTGSATLTLATVGDDADEANGSVSATVKTGTGYTVGTPSSGTVGIADDDDPPPAAAHPLVKYAPLVKTFHDRITARSQHGNGPAGGWNKRFLKALAHPEYVNYPQAAVTVQDATRLWNHGGPGANTAWDGTVEAVTYAEQYFAIPPTTDPVPVPEVSIAAGSGVTEGGDATFVLTASPAPTTPLDVTVTIAPTGDYGIAAGTQAVTIPAPGSVTLTLPTTNDDADEADGSVSVTVDAGTGYTVGTPFTGTVAIADDDDPPPAAAHPLVKYAPLVTSFYDRITANHQHGDSASGGWNKRFLKAMGHPEYVNYPQAAVTVQDATRLWNHGGPGANTAWDGTVEAVTYAEQYFGGQVKPPDPVSVPAVSIAAGADVTEGGSASFVLTATPAPAAALDVTVTIAADGDYGIADATQTVTIPTTGSATLTLPTTGDDADEADGSVSVTVDAGTGYTVGTPSSGTVAIADDDLPTPGNAAPAVANAIPDQAATAGTAFAFQVAANAFTDADGDTLTHSATRADGSALPSWLVFAPGTRTFSGTPAAADAGTLTVRVTADDGRGGTASDDFDVTVSAPAPVPEITIAAGNGVTEGGSASFVLTATPAPSAPLDVTVTIAASGDYGIANATQTVTIPTTGSATLTLATDNDGADEADGSVTATVDAGTGYTVGTASSGTVAVLDDDVPAIAIAAGADVTEGGNATFTLSADPVPHASLAVTVALTAEGAYGVTAGERTVTMPVSGTATLTVATTGDDADEPDGSVTATLKAGTGYTVGSASTATVAVRDDDEPVIAEGPSVLTLVARDLNGDAPGHVTEGGTAEVEVRLNPAPAKHVSLYYRTLIGTAYTHHDFRLIRPTRMQFRPGETVKVIRVRTVNDAHDEGLEDFSVRVWPATDDVTPKGGVIVTVTITNDDPMPAAWLARFGRTVAEQALDGIAGRMAAPRTPGMQGTIAGQALNFNPAASGQPAAAHTPGVSGIPSANDAAALAMADIARGLGAVASAQAAPVSTFGAGGASLGSAADPFGNNGFGVSLRQSRTMTARDALLGSSFSLTGQRDGAGGSLAFWGRASQSSFGGAERGDGTDITLDGTVTTGMLGADYARGKWLAGLALTQSTSEGGYAAEGEYVAGSELGCPPDGQGQPQVLCDGAVRAGDGDVEASLMAAIPYAALRVSERFKLWGAASYGTGEVTLKTAMGDRYSADTSWTMAAAGVRGDLLEAPKEGSGPALALTTDALWTETTSEKTRDLTASDSSVTRLRLGLEGSYRMALESDGHLTPKLEIGARHDGGDAETGFGVEIGGGIAWADPGLGLSLDLSGRTLLAHENDDLKDQGYSASLAFDPAPETQRGPSLSLRQDFGGQAQGGLDALFAPAPLEEHTDSEATSRWAMEAAYGFPAFGGRFTGSPHVGLGLSTVARDYSVGWRLAPEAASAPDLSFGVRATRREGGTVEAEHTVGFEVRARW